MVPQLLARPGSPQAVGTRGPAPTSSREWTSALGAACAPLSRSQVSPFFLSPDSRALSCPGRRQGNRKQRPAVAELRVGAASARRSPSCPQKKLFASSFQRSAKSPCAAAGGGARTRARPLASPACSPRGHVTITGSRPRPGAGESGAEIVGNSELYFPASRATSPPLRPWETYIQMVLKRKKEWANKWAHFGPAFGVGGISGHFGSKVKFYY